MPVERTESDILLQQATVALGGEPRAIEIKSLRNMREFRVAVGAMLASLIPLCEPVIQAFVKSSVRQARRVKDGDPELANADADMSAFLDVDLTAVLASLAPILIGEMPDTVVNLFWLYAPELKEEFGSVATYEEEIDAGLEVLAIVYPFVITCGKGIVKLVMRGRKAGLGL